MPCAKRKDLFDNSIKDIQNIIDYLNLDKIEETIKLNHVLVLLNQIIEKEHKNFLCEMIEIKNPSTGENYSICEHCGPRCAKCNKLNKYKYDCKYDCLLSPLCFECSEFHKCLFKCKFCDEKTKKWSECETCGERFCGTCKLKDHPCSSCDPLIFTDDIENEFNKIDTGFCLTYYFEEQGGYNPIYYFHIIFYEKINKKFREITNNFPIMRNIYSKVNIRTSYILFIASLRELTELTKLPIIIHKDLYTDKPYYMPRRRVRAPYFKGKMCQNCSNFYYKKNSECDCADITNISNDMNICNYINKF